MRLKKVVVSDAIAIRFYHTKPPGAQFCGKRRRLIGWLDSLSSLA